jgi:MULE transposase domain
VIKQKFLTVQSSYNKFWRGRELTIADIFGSWERSYEIFSSLLAAIQNFTHGTKYIIKTAPSTKFGVEIFDRVAWAFGSCIAAWPYLRPVLTIDTGFLSGRYAGKLFMACGYDAEQQLLPFAFAVVTDEKSVANWGWFMQWLRKEVVSPGKITVISDQHLSIRAIFEGPDFGWQESAGGAVHIRPTYKKIKVIFKQAARHKKPWRCKEYMKKINHIRPESYKFVRKAGIMQGNLPTEQVSNRRTRNNRNHNNQPAAAEEVSAEEFHYEELIPDQVAALHQERWAQHLDGSPHGGSESLNNVFRITKQHLFYSNGSESLNNVFRIARQLPICAIIENTWHKCVE